MMHRSGVVLGVALACALVAYLARSPRPAPIAPRAIVVAVSATEARELPRHVHAIVAGGGPSPELDQVSLEDDVALAQRVLGDGTIALFAGGPGTHAVQERALAVDGDALVLALGDLFAPRGGRDAHYRTTRLALHGGATADEIFAALELALHDGAGPLLFYFSGHGSGGDSPEESVVETWGSAGFDPPTLAELLEDRGTSRRVRLVITSCHSGGFAELAFRGADASLGPTDQDRCGFFSTAWDRESGGCDSDPDRSVHEGFGVHFLSALAGEERDGHDARAAIDLDHDGAITLAEAMARVRVASRAIDVPVTTSERLLRALAPRDGDGIDVELPEQTVVIDGLLASLRLRSVEEAQDALTDLELRRDALEDALTEAYASADDLAADTAGEALSRWPVLDDPYHPDYAATLAHEHVAIEEFFGSDVAVAWAEAADDAAALQTTHDALEVQIAVHMRVAQAAETIALARRLAAIGGSDWDAYARMRACEASVP
jgi:hypothetical protein